MRPNVSMMLGGKDTSDCCVNAHCYMQMCSTFAFIQKHQCCSSRAELKINGSLRFVIVSTVSTETIQLSEAVSYIVSSCEALIS